MENTQQATQRTGVSISYSELRASAKTIDYRRAPYLKSNDQMRIFVVDLLLRLCLWETFPQKYWHVHFAQGGYREAFEKSYHITQKGGINDQDPN